MIVSARRFPVRHPHQYISRFPTTQPVSFYCDIVLEPSFQKYSDISINFFVAVFTISPVPVILLSLSMFRTIFFLQQAPHDSCYSCVQLDNLHSCTVHIASIFSIRPVAREVPQNVSYNIISKQSQRRSVLSCRNHKQYTQHTARKLRFSSTRFSYLYLS